MEDPKFQAETEIQVKVAGALLSTEFAVQSVKVNYEVNRIAGAVITFADGDPANAIFPRSGGSTNLKPGVMVEVSFLRKKTDSAIKVFEGIIVAHNIRLRNSRSQLILRLKSPAIKLTIAEKNAVWTKKTDSEILKTILDKATGVSPDVKATTFKHDVLFQTNCTDWEFIRMRAAATGSVILCNGKSVSIKPPVFGEGKKLKLTYGQNLIELDLAVEGRSQIKNATAQSWDIKNQKAIFAKVESPKVKVPESAGKITVNDLTAAFKPAEVELLHRGALPKEALEAWANSRVMFSRMRRIKGNFKALGFEIYPGDTMVLAGLGKNFNGEVYVTGVQHELQKTRWTTEVSVGLFPDWMDESAHPGQAKAHGYTNAVPGLQVGKVLRLEGDPENLFRIEIDLGYWGEQGAPTKVWARMAFPNAGKARGLFWLPSVGDEVLVGFMHGDPAFPIVLGAFYNPKAESPLEYSKENAQKGIFTESKLKMVFDDKEKSITLETEKGCKIMMNDKQEILSLQDKHKNKIELSKTGIVIQSHKALSLFADGGKVDVKGKQGVLLNGQSNKVSIEASNVELSATQKLSAKGTSGVEIKSTGSTEIKGRTITMS